MADIQFVGYGSNVIGSLSSGSLVQDMPYDLSFDGDGDWVKGNFQPLESTFQNSFTMSAWVKPFNGQNGEQRTLGILGTWASSIGSVAIQANGKVTFTYSAGGNSGMASTADAIFPTGQSEWRHILATADSSVGGAGGLQIYIDGAHATLGTSGGDGSSGSTSGINFGDFAAPTNCYVQGGALNNDYEYSGSMRDLSVWSTKLTDLQIADVFKGDLPSTDQELWWKLDDNNATVQDSTSNNRDGTVTNSTWGNSEYNLNQIGAGSVSGATTISGGTWNLRDSTYLNFDETGDYIDVGDIAALELDTFSIAGWYYMDSSKSGADFLACNSDGGTAGWRLYAYGTNLLFYRATSSITVDITDLMNQWVHITASFTSGDMNVYVNGALHTNRTDVTGAPTYTSCTMDIGADGQRPTAGNLFKGYMRDIRFYNSVLTSSQVDLLYKGQWVGSPLGWWKLNEGTGDAATDSGTGGNNGSIEGTAGWVNPDFTGDGPQLKAGTTMSAPQGNYILKYFAASSPERDWNQSATSTFIHNSGTVKFSSGDTGIYNSTTAGPFYNILNDESNTFNMRPSSKTIVENSFFYTAGYWVMSNNASLQMGTTSSAGTISGNNVSRYAYMIGGGNTTFSISGASKVYPSIWKGTVPTETYWRGYAANSAGMATFKFKNLDIQDTVTLSSGTSTGGHNRATTFILEGDSEFDIVNVGAGCTFNAASQRAKFSGNFDMESGVNFVGSGSLLICDDKIKTDSASVYNSGTSVICGHAGTSTIRINDGDWETFMYNPTGAGATVDTNANVANNFIVAGGYFDMQNVNFSGDGVGKLQIATGGEFKGGDGVTHKITDTFNMAGGFIGKGAIDVTGVPDVSAEYMLASSFTDLVGATEATIECWFRPDDVAMASAGLISLFPAAEWNINVNKSGSDLYLGWEWENHGTEIYVGNGALLGPSNAGKWHHAAMTIHDTDGYRIYLDGKLVGSGAANGNDADVSSATLTVGSSEYGTGNYVKRAYDGAIARASVWKSALSESNIRSMLFQDWTTMAGADVVDDSKCVAWYEFGDSQTATSVTDKSGNGNTGTLSADVWAAPGTFAYETCILNFDKAGTCYLYGEQDGTSTDLYSLTVTNGTTLETFCESNDFIINSGATLVNSGTLNSNRNWQYKSPNMPIVGASSDLKVGNNIFYYFAPAVSGAGTEYRSFQPGNGVDLYMQGDFSAYSLYPYSDAIIHFNGYKGTVGYAGMNSYASGNVVLEPGSSINFNNASLRGFYANNGGNNSYITANGEACAMFNQFSDKNNTSNQNYIDTNAAIVPDDAAFTVSFWYKSPTDLASYSDTLTTAIGFNYNNEGGISLIGSNWLILCQGSVYRYFNSAPNADGLWHHMLAYVDPTNASNIKMWIDGSEQSPNSTSTGGTTSWSGDVQFGRGGYGAMPVSLADIRFYNAANTPTGSVATLAAINPATNVSGAYADPSNALSAYGWFKLNGTDEGLVSIADTIGTYNSAAFGTAGSPANGVKSGFVAVSGNAGFGAINRPYEKMTLTNTYISGMADIVVGQTSQGANGNSSLITKGKVVLE